MVDIIGGSFLFNVIARECNDRGNLRFNKTFCPDCFASLGMTKIFMNFINRKIVQSLIFLQKNKADLLKIDFVINLYAQMLLSCFLLFILLKYRTFCFNITYQVCTSTTPTSVPIRAKIPGAFDFHIRKDSGRSSPKTTYSIAPPAKLKERDSQIGLTIPRE